MNRKRLRAEFVGALTGANAKLIAALAPFSREAADTLASPRFQAMLEGYADAQIAVADAAKGFAATQSIEAADGLRFALLGYRNALLALTAAGDELKRKALAGELH